MKNIHTQETHQESGVGHKTGWKQDTSLKHSPGAVTPGFTFWRWEVSVLEGPGPHSVGKGQAKLEIAAFVLKKAKTQSQSKEGKGKADHMACRSPRI